MAKEPDRIVLAYRRVFSSEDGKIVLDDICFRGKLLNRCETPEDIGRENLAKEIVCLSLGEEGYISSMQHKFAELLKRLAKKVKKEIKNV